LCTVTIPSLLKVKQRKRISCIIVSFDHLLTEVQLGDYVITQPQSRSFTWPTTVLHWMW